MPYTTEFYSADLGASFSFEIYRLGMFVNIEGSGHELDPYLVENSDVFEEVDHPVINKGKVYIRKDLHDYQNRIASEVVKGVSRLRGGSKLAQFGADVSPKFMILAGMSVGGMIFDNLIVPKDGLASLNIKALTEIVGDYKEKITTKIYIGIREGYLANQEEIRALDKISGIPVVHGTPISVSEQFAKDLE